MPSTTFSKFLRTSGTPPRKNPARVIESTQPNPPKTLNETKDAVHLTPREVQVLTWLTKGYSYKMIANELQLGIETIRFYIKAIYKKLHVNSVSGAVSKALKDRLV